MKIAKCKNKKMYVSLASNKVTLMLLDMLSITLLSYYC